MSGYYCGACDEIRPLFPSDSAVDLDLPLLGRVPFDPQLAEICDRGETISMPEDSPCTKAIRDICDAVCETLKISEN